jgi:Protein of unknown function (DUF1275)
MVPFCSVVTSPPPLIGRLPMPSPPISPPSSSTRVENSAGGCRHWTPSAAWREPAGRGLAADTDRRRPFSLTVVTGVVDAVSSLALGHVFVANLTDNVVSLGSPLAGAPGLSAPAAPCRSAGEA